MQQWLQRIETIIAIESNFFADIIIFMHRKRVKYKLLESLLVIIARFIAYFQATYVFKKFVLPSGTLA